MGRLRLPAEMWEKIAREVTANPNADAEGAGAKNRSQPFDGGPRDACASRRRALN